MKRLPVIATLATATFALGYWSLFRLTPAKVTLIGIFAGTYFLSFGISKTIAWARAR